MGKYLQDNLTENESIVREVKVNPLAILGDLVGVLFWAVVTLLIVPRLDIKLWLICLLCLPLLGSVITLIVTIIKIKSTEVGYTEKKLIGKVGIFSTSQINIPLEKIDSVVVGHTLWGNIFKYGTINVYTATAGVGGNIAYVAQADAFKMGIIEQIDIAKKDFAAYQARLSAEAMADAIKMAKNTNS